MRGLRRSVAGAVLTGLACLGLAPATAAPAAATSATATAAASAGATAAATSATISGRVTDSGGSPLEGICVSAQDSSGPQSSTTASDGTYTIQVTPGTYTMDFFPGCGGGNYAIQWYPDESNYNSAQPITVSAGSAVTGIDAAMAPAGYIDGTVTTPAGTGQADVCVYAYIDLPGGQNITYNDVVTASDGTYELDGMPTGSYTVEFVPACSQPSGYSIQWYQDALSQTDAQSVRVQAPAVTGGIDAQLVAGGSVTGRVVDSNGAPVAGMCINPLEKESDGEVITFVEGQTGSDGTYLVTGLPPGDVYLELFPGCGGGSYVRTFYGGSSLDTAKGVPVTSGQTTDVPDVSVQLGGDIAGQVTDASGASLAGICVSATGSTDADSADSGSDQTDGSGDYDIQGLPAGSYQVEFFSGCAGGTYQSEWYQGASSASAATPVSVRVGDTTTAIDAVMTTGGGSTPAPSGSAFGPGGAPTPGVPGYWEVSPDGAVYAWGDAVSYGSATSEHLAAPIVGIARTPDSGGYWLVASDGGVFSFGDAAFHGSAGDVHLAAPIVGMAATPDGGGYWLVASDGGVFSFGDAAFHGSVPSLPGASGGRNVHLAAPIVGLAATPDGGGYWLVASDGGVFSFGDAAFHGSVPSSGSAGAGSPHLAAPIVGLAATPDGGGYWLAASDGGVFTYGDAVFHGSAADRPRASPVGAIARTPDGGGYWLAGTNGGIFWYGDAGFDGSADGFGRLQVVGLAATGS